MRYLPLLLLPVALAAVSCAPKKIYLNRDIASVAVIPPFMEVNDIESWKVMWPHVQQGVAAHGYAVLNEGAVQAFYAKNNFRGDPAEIRQYSTQELAKELKVDAIFYTNITRWGAEYAVVSSSVGVEAEFQLANGEDGAPLWNGEGKKVDSSGGSSLGGMLVGAVTKAVFDDPGKYCRGAVADGLRKLPHAGWDPEMKKAETSEGEASSEGESSEEKPKEGEKSP